MYACMHACMHGWMDVCMYVYIYAYIHMFGINKYIYATPKLDRSRLDAQQKTRQATPTRLAFIILRWWIWPMSPCLHWHIAANQVCFEHIGYLAPLLAALVAALLFGLWGLSPAIGGAIWWFLGYLGPRMAVAGWPTRTLGGYVP